MSSYRLIQSKYKMQVYEIALSAETSSKFIGISKMGKIL